MARDLVPALGSPAEDIAETAALAHDLGHPPFGTTASKPCASWREPCGGFEGNARTLPVLRPAGGQGRRRRSGRSSLNLTRATRTPAPSTRGRAAAGAAPTPEVRVCRDDDLPVFDVARRSATVARDRRRCVEAQVMDLADDVAYSVHDVEDRIVGGHMNLAVLDAGDRGSSGVWGDRAQLACLPGVDAHRTVAALDRVRSGVGTWVGRRTTAAARRWRR